MSTFCSYQACEVGMAMEVRGVLIWMNENYTSMV